MKVIILEDDAVREVKDGYARNYLFPKKLAILATAPAILQMEKRRQKKSLENEKHEAEAKAMVSKISKIAITLKAEAGEKDKLFGSIGNKEIAEALKEQQNIEIDRKKIILIEPIKTLGETVAQIKLFHGISAEIKIVVEKK
ncbi:MAG: 50S ribosomal protein L9 [Candidatus Saganbacteria bacterium]|nr:50S ribosomal protein L9 [Candidatus Saganbacteria bacterium]